MKMKKLLALVLSAVMAVSMLAACGGGGGAKNVPVNTSKVEEYLAQAGYGDIDVSSSTIAKNAAKQAASVVEKINYNALENEVESISAAIANSTPAGLYNSMYMYGLKSEMDTVTNGVELLTSATVSYLCEWGYGSDYGVAVVETTTADGIDLYFALAVSK